MKRLLLFSVTIAVMGCGSSPPQPVLKPNNNPAKTALAEKLKALPPDQRQQYMKDHPDEVREALMKGLAPTVSPARTNP